MKIDGYVEFIRAIRTHRENNTDLLQEDVARMLDVPASTISELERCNPTMDISLAFEAMKAVGLHCYVKSSDGASVELIGQGGSKPETA